MARNKYPEQTVEKILSVSLRLFLEKGYEHTTVQDIVDHLDGLSKGAIYHHFKGKEEIFEAVLDQLFTGREARMSAVMHDKTLNGCEKLHRMILDSLGDPAQDQLFLIAPNMSANARFLGLQILQVQEIARDYVEPIIREGIADGSIQTDHPRELAEMFLLIANFWLNPLIFPMAPEQMEEKCRFYRQNLAAYGLETLMDEEAVAHLRRYCELSAKNR